MALRIRHALPVVAVGVLGLAPVTACGGGGGQKPAAQAAATTPAAPATAPADPALATQQVSTAYVRFFSTGTPRDQQEALLEDGAQLGAAFDAAAKLLAHGTVSVTVSQVTFSSPTDASVTYTLSTNGQAVLPNANGKAVYVDGAWKVAKATFCQLVLLGTPDGKLAGCS